MSKPFTTTLCEFAAANVDGTFTVVRGGLVFWRGDLPLQIRLYAFSEFPPGAFQRGEEVITMEIRDSERLLGTGGSVIQANEPEKVVYVTTLIDFVAAKYGDISVLIRVADFESKVVLRVEPRSS